MSLQIAASVEQGEKTAKCNWELEIDLALPLRLFSNSVKSRLALNLLFLPGTGLFSIVTTDETAWHWGWGPAVVSNTPQDTGG